MFGRVPVRIRLATGFAVGMALVLILAGAFVYIEAVKNLSNSLDSNLTARADGVRTLVEGSKSGRVALADGRSDPEDDTFTQVLGNDGTVVDSTLPSQVSILGPDQIAKAQQDEITFDGMQAVGLDGDIRVMAEAAGNRVVVVGATTGDMEDTLSGLRRTFAIGGPVALLLASLIGYLLGSRALRPVEAMRVRAREITFDRDGERLPTPAAKDELRNLATTLNEMLDRIEGALQRERMFVSDASHELRTPLAILKSEIELVQRTSPSKVELLAALESAAEEVDHLVLLSENLLVIARADQGKLSLKREPVDVEILLERVRSRFESSQSSADRSITVENPGVGEYRFDSLRLEQALGNLVDNALKHGDGQVTLGAVRNADGLTLYIKDEGCGFDPDFRDQALERFSQAESGRTDTGTGLGLAIVRAITQAHGGLVEIRDVDPGGAEVRLSFPSERS